MRVVPRGVVRPDTDGIGSDGAMYVSDWQNIIIGDITKDSDSKEDITQDNIAKDDLAEVGIDKDGISKDNIAENNIAEINIAEINISDSFSCWQIPTS